MVGVPHEERPAGCGDTNDGANQGPSATRTKSSIDQAPGYKAQYRIGCPAGCPDFHEHPRIAEPLPDLPRNLRATRRAWLHLYDLGYIGDDDREWWLRALGMEAA